MFTIFLKVLFTRFSQKIWLYFFIEHSNEIASDTETGIKTLIEDDVIKKNAANIGKVYYFDPNA
ncbi:hypothetical protein ACQKND_05820 [Viridibacillus arvi]|uniref:hypothetical protein n=1 Tax=Viridibacillus arvi TaxID=263475 RepID=UPI003D077481